MYLAVSVKEINIFKKIVVKLHTVATTQYMQACNMEKNISMHEYLNIFVLLTLNSDLQLNAT
jgi:hypothetical protein